MTKTETNTPSEVVEVKLCQCNSIKDGEGGYTSCNAVVTSKKGVFAPGHDAKLKGALIAAFRAGNKTHTYLDLETGKKKSMNVAKVAEERGWEKFLVEKKAPKKRAPKPKVEKPAADAEPVDLEPEVEEQPEWLVYDEPSTGKAKIGRTTYDVQVTGQNVEGDKLTISYVDKKDNTKEATVDASKVEID